ncbi:hypothetical protein BASA62_007759 [Batrachochytrium salamandrivorans]|nr:hypothetical protein BASA62_007759 [Batrachochytrium salamandrivorans]
MMDGDDDVVAQMDVDTDNDTVPAFIAPEKTHCVDSASPQDAGHDADGTLASGIKTPYDQGIVPPAFISVLDDSQTSMASQNTPLSQSINQTGGTDDDCDKARNDGAIEAHLDTVDTDAGSKANDEDGDGDGDENEESKDNNGDDESKENAGNDDNDESEENEGIVESDDGGAIVPEPAPVQSQLIRPRLRLNSEPLHQDIAMDEDEDDEEEDNDGDDDVDGDADLEAEPDADVEAAAADADAEAAAATNGDDDAAVDADGATGSGNDEDELNGEVFSGLDATDADTKKARELVQTAKQDAKRARELTESSFEKLYDLKMKELQLEAQLIKNGNHPDYVQLLADIEARKDMKLRESTHRLHYTVRNSDAAYEAGVKLVQDSFLHARRFMKSNLIIKKRRNHFQLHIEYARSFQPTPPVPSFTIPQSVHYQRKRKMADDYASGNLYSDYSDGIPEWVRSRLHKVSADDEKLTYIPRPCVGLRSEEMDQDISVLRRMMGVDAYGESSSN